MAQPGQRKVIVGLDGSKASKHAFEWYLKNLKQPTDYVYGIHVPEYSFKGVTVGPFADAQALSNEFQTQHAVVESLCANYTADLRKNKVSGQVDAMPGDKPGPTICQQVESLNADAVVMGTRGRSGFKKMLLGSVSQFVVNHSPVPVTVIPCKESEEQTTE